MAWGAFIAWSGGFYTLPTRNFGILCPSMAVVGFFTLPMLPVGYAFGVEVSYPVSQAMSNGIMTFFMQIVSTIVAFIGGWLCDHYEPLWALTFFVAQFAVGAMCSLWVKEDLRRLNNEIKS